VLSYLEWVRLINTGGIRLDERRITRWSPQKSRPTEVIAELMSGAPDLGTSANAFVMAMLEPDVLDRVRLNGMDLGKRLSLESVRSFHSFTETAVDLHSHDATSVGCEITLTPLGQSWIQWVNNVEDAERQAKGTALLQLFSLPQDDWSAEWVASQESRIDYEKIAKSRDTMYYGWACVLNSVNARPGVALDLPTHVREEIMGLQRTYDVEQPFLAAAPLLSKFVETIRDEADAPTDLLALAALKQHERYVTKRDGAAVDIKSLTIDVNHLKERDSGSATMLVQVLGERLPGELIRALKAGMMGTTGSAQLTGHGDDIRISDETEANAERNASAEVAGDKSTVAGEDLAPKAVSVGRATTASVTTGRQDFSVTEMRSVANSESDTTSFGEPTPTKDHPPTASELQPSFFDAPDNKTRVDETRVDETSIAGETVSPKSGRVSGQPSSPPKPGGTYGKYTPLHEHLQNLPFSAPSVSLSFTEIETIIDAELPKSSRAKKAFWSNEGKMHARAWREAGFRTVQVFLDDPDTDPWVQFERVSKVHQP
jgi:hypothetical protein